MRRRRVLVINLGWEQEPLIDSLARREDLELYGVHYDENFYRGAEWKDVLVCDLRDLPSILKFADSVKPHAVVSDQCDYSHFAQAVIAERYGLPGPEIRTAQIATNKFLQRKRAEEEGILVPRFRLCTSPEEALRAVKELGLPAVLKPTDNRGSFGVTRVDHIEEVEEAFYEALAHSHSRFILVEEFIRGVHITVDGYAFRERGPVSLALATKKLIGTKHQVAMDILYPGDLPPELYRNAMRLNEEVNRKIGFSFGMLHSEYMVSERGIFLIESANRGGGVYTSEIIVPEVSGVDVVSQYISDCLGENQDLYTGEVQTNRVLLKFFKLPPGRIKSIEGLEELRSDPRVLKLRLSVKEGDTVEEITNDAARHGFLILRAEGDVFRTAEEMIARIRIEYEEDGDGPDQ